VPFNQAVGKCSREAKPFAREQKLGATGCLHNVLWPRFFAAHYKVLHNFGSIPCVVMNEE